MIAKDINALVRKGELTKIENYDKAVADNSQMWVCHHRLELTLDGEFAHSKKELERMRMYYHRPYFELIFLTDTEHRSLHGKTRSESTKKKLSEKTKGEMRDEEFRKRRSEAMKGKKLSEETRKKIGEASKGKKRSEEVRKKASEVRKNKPKSNYGFGKKYFEHFGYSRDENIKQYVREYQWYRNHNKTCRWE